MEKQMVKVDADEFKQLIRNVEMIKSYLFCHKPDLEGELSDWAKNELEEARRIPDSENFSLEELEKEILGK
jgi:hypothetical protein